jgi:hypothetical protein
VEPLGFDGVVEEVEFPIDQGLVGGAHGLLQAAIILNLSGFEETSFDGTAALANGVLRDWAFRILG